MCFGLNFMFLSIFKAYLPIRSVKKVLVLIKTGKKFEWRGFKQGRTNVFLIGKFSS